AFWRDVRAALAGGVGVGAGAVVVAALALFALGLAGSDPSPVGRVMLAVAALALLALATCVALAAGAWEPRTGWRAAVGGLRDRLDADPVAALYTAGAVLALALLTWQLPPLAVPGLGLLALALVAVPERRRRGAEPVEGER
ncbi:hypothetical protein HLA99_16545, partial [Microbacterium ulmi]|nr:hypothetical protein [Microbacterium ulmi]